MFLNKTNQVNICLIMFTILSGFLSAQTRPKNSISLSPRPMEYLDRGLVAMESKKGIFLSWRMLGTDNPEIGFNLYRNGEKINSTPITDSTNYLDTKGKKEDTYLVETLISQSKRERSSSVSVWPRKQATRAKKKPAVPYMEIPLSEAPSDKHIPGDMSIGDLDGDGKYDLVFEWEGSPPYLEAVNLEGKQLWRITLGPNVTKKGVALLVYDFDGDGKAEVACKTGPGTKDGTGKYLSKGPAANDDDSVIIERKSSLMLDPAYLTVFKGETGEELMSAPYWPSIGPKETMQETWGDNRGYRAASIKAAVLYNKDLGPLMVVTRGIYSRIAMGAYTWNGKELKRVWTFDSEDPKHPEYRGYRSQGNHSVAVGDVDNDGSDELMYGACAIDHDGKGLYTTGMGHGDSHSLSDHDPDRPGLEYYQGHENRTYGLSMREAGTGKIIWEIRSKADVGRAWAADISPDYRGSECTSTVTPTLDCKGNEVPRKLSAYNQLIYFDGDVQRDIRNRTNIDDASGPEGRILTGWYYGASDLHSSKHDVNLVADIFGDWREEMICRRYDNKAFIIFSTWIPTKRKNYTLMHDPVYRMNIAVQNIGYNQPAHVGFYFADGAPTPNIRLVKNKK